MKILFTLDYELFMGHKAGTVDRCLIQPLNRYIDAVSGYGVRFTVFVDAAYLYALHKFMDRYAILRSDYCKIVSHVASLHRQGHDIQLHIHPQWYYSEYDGTEWRLDTRHYKLADMPAEEMHRLFKASKDILDGIIGSKTTAFRAGGFSAQPTSMLTELFADNGLTADSSVCPGERYDSEYQQYDYSSVGQNDMYRFEADLCKAQHEGRYMEVPLSMCRVGRIFHWKLLLVRLATKVVRRGRHCNYGDGQSVPATRESIVRRLLHACCTVATIDGYKISFLKDAITACERRGCRHMCILGHPKLATPYSVDRLAEICAYAKRMGHQFYTMSQLAAER